MSSIRIASVNAIWRPANRFPRVVCAASPTITPIRPADARMPAPMSRSAGTVHKHRADGDRHDQGLGHPRHQDDLRPDVAGAAVLEPGVGIAGQQRPFQTPSTDREQPSDDGDRRQAEDVAGAAGPGALRPAASRTARTASTTNSSVSGARQSGRRGRRRLRRAAIRLISAVTATPTTNARMPATTQAMMSVGTEAWLSSGIVTLYPPVGDRRAAREVWVLTVGVRDDPTVPSPHRRCL